MYMDSHDISFHQHIVRPVLEPDVRRLCTRPYPNHPKGCPNHGKRPTCPPDAKLFPELIDASYDVWSLWSEFALSHHVKRMKSTHPLWTPRQLVCCLYWQGTVRKYLRNKADDWMNAYKMNHPSIADRLVLLECPEAMGINVTATMRHIGVHLEWPPKHLTRMVYLMGVAR